MSLNIYSNADSSTFFSVDGAFTNPIIYSLDGITGGTLVQQYYLRNDDDTKYYTSITISPYVESGDDITDGTNGFSWKLIGGSTQPLEQQWAITEEGNTLEMDNIGSSGNGDDTTYFPFWLRITVPHNLSAQAFSNIKLRISFTENIV